MNNVLFIICFLVALALYYAHYAINKDKERSLKYLRTITFGRARKKSFVDPDAFISRFECDFYSWATIWAFAAVGAYISIPLMIFCIIVFAALYLVEAFS